MLHTFDGHLHNVALSSVAFFDELPALLGVSRVYVRQLCSVGLKSSSRVFGDLSFPDPFFVSESGVRVWWVRDLESWCLKVRSRRRTLNGAGLGSSLIDRVWIADEILGRD